MLVYRRRKEAPSAGFSELAASVFTDLIKEQLAEERARKASLEQRGGFVITTAGALVTLLFGLAAVVTARKTFVVPYEARVLIAVSVVFFFAAAVGGLVANLPWNYAEVDEAALVRLVKPELWTGPVVPAARRSAEALVEILKIARAANEKKAFAVIGAFGAEMTAVAFVAAAVAIVLV